VAISRAASRAHVEQSTVTVSRAPRAFSRAAEIDPAAVQLVESTDRALIPHILKLDKFIDLVIPRGGEALIRTTIREEWHSRRFAWSPEGAATLAALPALADLKLIGPGDRVVLVNTASPEKYLPTIRDLFDGGL